MSCIKNLLLILSGIVLSVSARSQDFALEDGPWFYDTYSPASKIKVSVLVSGIKNPWGMAILPNGNILVAEKSGQLRIIRDGVLDQKPLPGAPKVTVAAGGGFARCGEGRRLL